MLHRFAAFVVAATAILIFAGGLVTSTGSGLSVPDWPNTFGTNMFLYPLGPRAAPDVFLEHSHRLFGTLVGLSAIAMVPRELEKMPTMALLVELETLPAVVSLPTRFPRIV